MAYHKERQQAIEMAKKGYSSSEIAEIIKTPIRNVQRWLSAARKDGSLKRTDLLQIATTEIQSDTQPIVPEQEEISESSHDILPTTLGLLYDAQFQTDRWAQALKKLVNEHIETHRNVRQKIEEMLTAELNSEEPSFKKIHVLSIALSRHCDSEMKAFTTGRGDMLTLSQAATLLYAQNFMVLQQSAVPELVNLIHSQKDAS
ncbi:hypothetical protein [Scytonema sp. PCC 10023]|uniref:hypothetical protein n=1 Tax=Scytonema sp. PCC 10023 TaxID=1680591 RepID=UPI0039C5B46E